jgi:hypothetical protein
VLDGARRHAEELEVTLEEGPLVSRGVIGEQGGGQQGRDPIFQYGAKSPHEFEVGAIRHRIRKTPFYVNTLFQALVVRPTGRA